MTLGVLRMPSDESSRLGIITTRKAGGAVERVRFRRRVREFFRLARGSWPSGYWLVVVMKSAAARCSAAVLRRDWDLLCRRAGLPEAGR